MPTELGAHNPRIERVRELLHARGRRDQRRFAIEGLTLIEEALRSGLAIRELYAAGDALEGQPAIAALERQAVPVFRLAPRLFARLSDLQTPTGLLAVIDLPDTSVTAVLARPGPVLLLAGVSDPGNAGTLLRSAEAFGAAGVLFGRGGVDPFAPKVVRAAMGSLFRLPVASVDAAAFAELAAQAGRPIAAADMEGADIETTSLPPNVVVAIGNERRGVRDWLPRWDITVRIPHAGPAESLNAAVAGSIVLYVLSRVR